MKEKKFIHRIILFVIGVFIIAFTYNLFVVPYNFVIGGLSGLAIIFSAIFHLPAVIFIYSVDVILTIISFIFLGKEKTCKSVVGAILYPVLITLTMPLTNMLIPLINIDNIVITIILTGGLLGIGYGLVYKAGYTTGGGDVIMQIMNKYIKISEGQASLIMDIAIILLGGLFLGIAIIIYSSIIIIIETNLVDKILIGISDSKMFFIYSKENNNIKDYVLKNMDTGVTLLDTEGAYNKEKNEMLMVVVPTKDYYSFKAFILEMDSNAFFIVSDCYEVNGGRKRKNLSFI